MDVSFDLYSKNHATPPLCCPLIFPLSPSLSPSLSSNLSHLPTSPPPLSLSSSLPPTYPSLPTYQSLITNNSLPTYLSIVIYLPILPSLPTYLHTYQSQTTNLSLLILMFSPFQSQYSHRRPRSRYRSFIYMFFDFLMLQLLNFEP